MKKQTTEMIDWNSREAVLSERLDEITDDYQQRSNIFVLDVLKQLADEDNEQTDFDKL